MIPFLSLMIFLPILSAIPVYLVSIKSEKAAVTLGLLVLVITFLLSLYLVIFPFNHTNGGFQLKETFKWLPWVGAKYHVAMDGISAVMAILGTFLCLIAGWSSYWLIPHEKGKWYAVLLIFETGVLGTFLCLNLAVFYIFWELVLIPMFFMIGEWGPKPEKARRAAIKFLIYTHVGAIVMLLGFIYIFTETGSFGMIGIAGAENFGLAAQRIAMALTFFGFAFKLPVFPFHTWLPDAHVEAPSPASVLLAGLLLKMAGYGFIRAVWLFPKGMEYFTLIFIILAVISVLYSGIVAIMQEDMKKMIAYSSINHMGYVLLATTAAATASVGTVSSTLLVSNAAIFKYCILGAVFVMFSHGVIIGILFLLAGIIHHSAGTREISKIKGLANKMPWVAFLLLIGGIAAGGMPGMIGFVGELLVFVGSVSALFGSYWWISFALAGPLIVLAFMIWLNQRVFFGEFQLEGNSEVENPSVWELLPLAVLVIPIILFGIYPEALSMIMRESIKAIAP